MRKITKRSRILDRVFMQVMRSRWGRLRLRAFRPGPGGIGEGLQAFTGEKYDYATLELAMKVNSWVAACVIARTSAIKKLPLKVMRETAGKREEVFSGDSVGGDLVDLLWRPAPMMSSTEFKEQMAGYISLDGEAIVFINNGNAERLNPIGRPVSLQVLKPRHIEDVKFLPSGEIDKYLYRQQYEVTQFAPEFMIHPKTFNPYDDGRGLPPVEIARRPVLLKEYMGWYAERFFENSSRPDGVLVSSHPLDTEIKKENIEFWEAAHRGVDNSHRVAHLDADTQYQVIGTSNKDSEFIALDELTVEQILAIFGVPPVLVGRFKWANYANSKEQIAIFYEFTVEPMAMLIADAINMHLIERWWPGQGLYVEFDFRDVQSLQEDMLEQAKRHSMYLDRGVMSPNEVRLQLGLPARTDPRGDSYSDIDEGDLSLMGLDGVPLTKAVLAPSRRDQWEAFDRQLSIGERGVSKWFRMYFAEQEIRVIRRLSELFDVSLAAAEALTSKLSEIDASLIYQIFDEAGEAKIVADEMVAVLTRIFEQVGPRAMRQVKPDGVFNLHDPRVTDWIKNKTLRLGRDVNDVTRRGIQKILTMASAEDATVQETARRIRAKYKEFKTSRTRTIARTESLGASNQAALSGYGQSGVVKKKQWLSTIDDVTRDSHLSLDGAVEKIDSDFSNGLSAPGVVGNSGFVDAGEIVNCRCTVLPVLED